MMISRLSQTNATVYPSRPLLSTFPFSLRFKISRPRGRLESNTTVWTSSPALFKSEIEIRDSVGISFCIVPLLA